MSIAPACPPLPPHWHRSPSGIVYRVDGLSVRHLSEGWSKVDGPGGITQAEGDALAAGFLDHQFRADATPWPEGQGPVTFDLPVDLTSLDLARVDTAVPLRPYDPETVRMNAWAREHLSLAVAPAWGRTAILELRLDGELISSVRLPG